MHLQEFLLTANPDNNIALAEAQAYEQIEEQMISSDVMTMLLLQANKYGEFQNSTIDLIVATMDRIKTQSEFNFKQSKTKGQMNIGSLNYLNSLDSNLVPTTLIDSIIAEANKVTKPFENVTLAEVAYNRQEVIDLGVQLNGGIKTLTITENPDQPVRVMIEERIGNDATDKLDWQELVGFSGGRVDHKYRTHQASVPASTTPYRELRVVSPVTLGMSIA